MKIKPTVVISVRLAPEVAEAINQAKGAMSMPAWMAGDPRIQKAPDNPPPVAAAVWPPVVATASIGEFP